MTERGTSVNHGAKAYRRLNVSSMVDSANPQQLIQMMFDGALARLKRARGCIEHGDIPGRTEGIDGALAILSALQGCLDHEKGGQLAENLDALYDYMQRRLYRAQVDNEAAIVDEVVDLLRTLADAWEAIEPATSTEPVRPATTA